MGSRRATDAAGTVRRGTPAFPADLRLDLDLVDERRFDNGAVRVRYRVVR